MRASKRFQFVHQAGQKNELTFIKLFLKCSKAAENNTAERTCSPQQTQHGLQCSGIEQMTLSKEPDTREFILNGSV